MLKILINVINLVFITYLRFKYDKNTHIKIYDLDNTLANTYPTITIHGKISFSQLEVFPKVLKMVLKDYQTSNTIVLFFTVRPLKNWKTTYSWINIKVIHISFYQLFMCRFPMHKVYLINKLRKKWSNITLIDDMSYNHENGDVKFYSNAIDAVKAIGIEYIGYPELRKFQQEDN